MLARNPTRNTANRVNGISEKTVLFFNGRLLISAVIPRIRNIFAILLPSTFPTAISELPLKLAKILIISSGAEVPKDTIVSPIIRFDILYLEAKDEDPSTR